MKLRIFLSLILFFAAVFPQKKEYSKLRAELILMQERDQQIRESIIKGMSSTIPDTTLVPQMYSIDSANTYRMKQIIQEYGWPGRSLIGSDGADAVFLIVQHSSDKVFQRTCLPLMEQAFKAGEASGPDLALLTDRVLLFEGKPQLYGSQAKIMNGKIEMDSIQDSANVDKRRASMGLSSMKEYLKLLKEMYHIK